MTELSYLAAVRESYDTVAAAYAELVKPPAELDALSRAMLAAFAEVLRAADAGPVVDVGCGPGFVTAYLAEMGVPVFGIDVSPAMVDLARRAHPAMSFRVGSMTALDVEDDALGGILAHYSLHHTPPELLPVVFAEFHRTLAPGGLLNITGHVGTGEHLRPTEAYGGHRVSYESYLTPPSGIADLLTGAGLVVTARLLVEPTGGATRSAATFLAHKPS